MAVALPSSLEEPRDSEARADSGRKQRAVPASPWVTFEHGRFEVEFLRSQKFRCVAPSRKVNLLFFPCCPIKMKVVFLSDQMVKDILFSEGFSFSVH